ncbi:hypothetical protein [Aeromonas enteropelogenes]|uniref:hypothetical protein n=1 Tax=Aeromonas enteropelogenes TaxID=29489 RepID=UPI003BA3B431
MSMAWFIAGCVALVVGIVGALDAYYRWQSWSDWPIGNDHFWHLFKALGFVSLAVVGGLLMAVHGGYL